MTNFLRICIYWSEFLGTPVSPRQFVHMMTLMKVARDQHSFKVDNHIDIMGYEVGLGLVLERMQDLGYGFEEFEGKFAVHNMLEAYRASIALDADEDKEPDG